MEKERTQPADATGVNKSPAPATQAPEDPRTSPASENMANARSTTVRKPPGVSASRAVPKQEKLSESRSKEAAEGTTSSHESRKGVVLDKQEPRLPTPPASRENMRESEMLVSRISRLEKGYELLIGRNIQLQV